jgi:hypothetical protein
MHNAAEIRADVHAQRVAEGMATWIANPDPCTPASVPTPRVASRHILVEVGGLGSTSDAAAVARVDAAMLGFAPEDVVRFSYRGGRVPPADAGRTTREATGAAPPPRPERPEGAERPERLGHHGLDGLPSTTYGVADSEGDLVVAGVRLAELLDRIASAEPGVAIDLVAHSQGGIVARLALDPTITGHVVPAAVRTVVTLATPVQGADLAAVIASARSTAGGAEGLARVGAATGVDLDPASVAARQLVPTSPVIRHLAQAAPPPAVWFTSVGVRGDLVVAGNRTVSPGPSAGEHHTILPLGGVHAHDEVAGDPATTREIALAVAGLPPTCRGLVQVATDLVVSEAVSLAEATAAVPTAGLAGELRWPVPQGSP